MYNILKRTGKEAVVARTFRRLEELTKAE